MDDRGDVWQCAHQFGVDGGLAGIDNRFDRSTMLGEEILAPRIDRQHQSVVFRGQRLGERGRNFTHL